VNAPLIEVLGDEALHVRFGDSIDPSVSDQVLAATDALSAAPPAGVRDLVPGYASLLVLYDPLQTEPAALRAWITATLNLLPLSAARPRRRVEIPVLYDAAVAPDLLDVAAEKGMTVEQLMTAHSAPVYRCYLLGFRPGFPFLGGLPPALATARLPTPRLRVPAGSVGIGGQQTGVYPVDSPGGWRLIGRTPARLFDPAREDPFLVHAGDDVVFVPIDPSTFAAWRG
jgi:inhibitor of KinA